MATNINLTDAELDSIMERIQKMMRLRDNPAATVGEVANAAAMIQSLLDKYNLTLSEIGAHKANGRNEYDRKDFDLGVSGNLQSQWRSDLMWAITRTNWCRAILLHGRKGGYPFFNKETGTWDVTKPTNSRMALIGKPYNVQVCIELYQFLYEELNRLATLHWKQYAAMPYNDVTKQNRAGKIMRFRHSFFMGAVSEISARLAEQRRQSSAQITALVVVSDKALTTEVSKHFPLLKHGVRRSSVDGDAYAAGQHVGRNIGLTPTRKIDSSSTRRLNS